LVSVRGRLHSCVRYTRNLVDSGNDRFNLMALCWGEGHGSSVHDHSDAHCFVKVLDGQLKETMFDWPSTSQSAGGDIEVDVERLELHEPLRQTAINYYDKDGVTYINGWQQRFSTCCTVLVFKVFFHIGCGAALRGRMSCRTVSLCAGSGVK